LIPDQKISLDIPGPFDFYLPMGDPSLTRVECCLACTIKIGFCLRQKNKIVFSSARSRFLRSRFMSTVDPSVAEQQRRYREFLDLMPLMISIAGLPASDIGKYYTEEQMETRIFALRHAYKMARQFAREQIAR